MMSASSAFPKDVNLLTATIEELQGQLAHGRVTSVQLVENYSVRLELRTVSTDTEYGASSRIGSSQLTSRVSRLEQ